MRRGRELRFVEVKAKGGPEALVLINYHSGAGTVTDWKIIAAQEGKLRSFESRPIRTGFSSSASAGAFGFYVRGEFEHAPSAPGFSQAVVNAIQITDQKPLALPASSIPAFNQFRLLDSYVMLNLKGWQASFGKQSFWLGQTQDPFLFSNNAEPIYMFRVSQTSPRKFPSFLSWLGPYRTEFFVGKLTGQHFVNTQDGNIAVSAGRSLERQPMINGLKVTFKPTPNFEFGVGRTGLWGGPNFPITAGSTRHSLFSTGNAAGPDSSSSTENNLQRSTQPVNSQLRVSGKSSGLIL